MAAAPLPLVTLEEYLHTDYRPDCDFVDGYLEERTLGELARGTLQVELGYWFRQRRDEWQVSVLSELRTRVSPSAYGSRTSASSASTRRASLSP